MCQEVLLDMLVQLSCRWAERLGLRSLGSRRADGTFGVNTASAVASEVGQDALSVTEKLHCTAI